MTGTTLPPLEGGPSSIEADDRELVTLLKRIWDHEIRIRQPHEMRWNRSVDRKNLIFDFSKKRPWQSRRVIPSYTFLCLKVAWELAKPVALATGPLFEATTDLAPWRDLLDIPTEILQEHIKSNGQNPEGDFNSAWFAAMDTMTETGNAHILIAAEDEGMIDLREDSVEDIFSDVPESILPDIDELPLPSLGGVGELPPLSNGTDDKDPFADNADLTKQFSIRFEALDPRNVITDSANPRNPTYKMWRQYLAPWQFEDLAKKHGWDNVEEVLKTVQVSTRDQTDNQRIGYRNNLENRPAKEQMKQICVIHCVGTLPGRDGKAYFKNKYCARAGDFILKRPVDLGYWHKKIPIVSGGMLKRAFGAYHDSLAVINLDPQEARNEMLNSLLDYMQQVINPPTEVNHDRLHQSIGAKQLAGGLTPGGVLHVQGTASAGPAIARSAIPDMPSGMWQGLGHFEQRLQETTGMSDIGSMPRTRNRISADEAAERQSMSGGIWQKCLLVIENEFLAPCLNQAWYLALQKTSEDKWKSTIQKRIDRITKGTQGTPAPATEDGLPAPDTQTDETNAPLLKKLQAMLGWDAKTRWRKMASPFRFQPKVFSSVESKRRGLEQLAMLVEASSQNPALAASVKWRKVAEQYLLKLDLDPADFLWPNEGQTAEQQLPATGLPPGAPGPVSSIVPPPPGPGQAR